MSIEAEAELPISEKIQAVEERVFGPVADHFGIRPFNDRDTQLVEQSFVDMNGVRFETPQGEKGRVPLSTDGDHIDFKLLEQVGSFTVRTDTEGHSVLGFVDRRGHALIGLSTAPKEALLLSHGYRRNPELQIPFGSGEIAKDGILQASLVKAGLRPPLSNS